MSNIKLSSMRQTSLLWAVCFGLCALVTASGCSSSHLMELTPTELEQKFRDDLVQIKRYNEGLDRVMNYAEERGDDVFKKKNAFAMSLDTKQELRVIWREVIDYMYALDAIKSFWEHYTDIYFSERPVAHAQAYLAGYAAWMVQQRHGLRFMDLTIPSDELEVILDEPVPQMGIPGEQFAAIKLAVIHVKSLWQLVAGREYLRVLEDQLEGLGCNKSESCLWAMEAVDPYVKEARSALARRGVQQYSYAAFDIFRDVSFSAWFPLQKGVAEWMGDTRVARLHKHLITGEQLATMQASMEPGDIVVARHNWYLSNIGLPGFWPHAELYIGSPAELDAFFGDDPGVAALIASRHPGAGKMSEVLSALYAEAFANYTSAPKADPYRVIEAVSEGVVFHTLEKAAGADYVGVMRMNLDKVAKAQAVLKAFELWGRPYDFNFDFLTDQELVCTELVYKAWQPDSDKKGLEIGLEEIAGRKTLGATSIVRYFDERYDEGEAKRPLSFVYFLDGQEREGAARVSTLEAFRESWRRPKWDIVQK